MCQNAHIPFIVLQRCKTKSQKIVINRIKYFLFLYGKLELL